MRDDDGSFDIIPRKLFLYKKAQIKSNANAFCVAFFFRYIYVYIYIYTPIHKDTMAQSKKSLDKTITKMIIEATV